MEAGQLIRWPQHAQPQTWSEAAEPGAASIIMDCCAACTQLEVHATSCQARHLEVGGVRFVGQQEVLWFDVAVHHTQGVQVSHLQGNQFRGSDRKQPVNSGHPGETAPKAAGPLDRLPAACRSLKLCCVVLHSCTSTAAVVQQALRTDFTMLRNKRSALMAHLLRNRPSSQTTSAAHHLHHAAEEAGGICLREGALGHDALKQLAAHTQLHDDVHCT